MPYRRTPAIQARLDAQRARLLAAGADVLAESGYAACTVAAVAARAGVATGTVYNHFERKGDLTAELFRTIVGREVDAVRTAVAAERSAHDQVRSVVETFAGRALKQPRRAYALLAEPVDAVVDALRLEFRREFRDVIAASIADGVARGELPPQTPHVVAAALVGAIAEAMVGPLAGDAPDPDALPSLIAFARRAIGAEGGRPHADA